MRSGSRESLLSLRHDVQAALFRLGYHPTWHQTDNSTAAAATDEAAVESVLSTLLDACKGPDIETIRESLGMHKDHGHVPLVAAFEVDLGAYDELLRGAESRNGCAP